VTHNWQPARGIRDGRGDGLGEWEFLEEEEEEPSGCHDEDKREVHVGKR
jgi:hypothetical protein